MTLVTKNLGLIKAIHSGITPPTNTDMLWYDSNIGIKLHKYYDFTTSSWENVRGDSYLLPFELKIPSTTILAGTGTDPDGIGALIDRNIELVPAPGGEYKLSVIAQIDIYFEYGGVSYNVSEGGSLILTHNNETFVEILSEEDLESTSDIIRHLTFNCDAKLNTAINIGLYDFSGSTPSISSGNGNLYIKGFYNILDFSTLIDDSSSS